jgi:cellulose synthase/poly-beta-1,6-N-acetylglucosamine synthase-like glycosyltransferase
VSFHDLPRVTVQLPIFNERLVVGRLIDAAVNMDYPSDRLQIQVIDDSTDETTQNAANLVYDYREKGVDITLLHRPHRQGFKAGALAAALEEASGEFIAVFDADFQPQPEFLRQTIPHFLDDPALGMTQARWGHLNPNSSQLTAAQTIALDKHFAMEQTVRHRANLFPKFNGSAGVWRRRCLEDAGGWEADTVCEDLCLSTRAILKGWQFRFLNDVVAPAELPATISAYKNQQSRWAKGSTQCLVKFGPAIISDPKQSRVAKIYALLSMAGYTTHLLLLILLLVQVPLIYLGYKPPMAMLLVGVAGLFQPLLFIMGQRVLYPDWLKRLRYFPALLLVAIGLAPANSRAILQALFGRQHAFVRTPKGHQLQLQRGNSKVIVSPSYRLTADWIILAELFLAAYSILGLALCIHQGNFGPSLFMAACALGFGYVAISSIRELF